MAPTGPDKRLLNICPIWQLQSLSLHACKLLEESPRRLQSVVGAAAGVPAPAPAPRAEVAAPAGPAPAPVPGNEGI